MIRRLARGAVAFLDWLDAHDLTLGTCRQADLDRWLADDTAVYRDEAGRLIRWARASKLTAGHLAAARWNGPAQLLDRPAPLGHRAPAPARRRPQARGPPRRAARPALRPGRDRDQPADRRPDPGQRRRRPPPPRPRSHPPARAGRHDRPRRAGQPQGPRHHRRPAAIALAVPRRPARPADQHRAADQRLNDLGIRPGQARSTALFQLATEIPAAILARTLGISTDVAVTWQRHAAGDWTTYAADVSHRLES